MTVKRLVTPGRWEGLAGDIKPTNSTHPGKVRAGDTYYATDTGLLYISLDDDGSSWVEKLSPSPGVQATSLGKAEDAQHSSGDTGVMMLGVRQDIPSTMASQDGDYTPPSFDQLGRLRVTPSTGGTYTGGMIGKPHLRATHSGWAVWEEKSRTVEYALATAPTRQNRQGPWAAHLNGGTQDASGTYQDRASVEIPINEMHLTDLDEMMYTYYRFLAGTTHNGAAAPNISIRAHDPDDHDSVVEISQSASQAGSMPTAGWHEVIITTATEGMMWYGTNAGTPDTCVNEGGLYTWANFQEDSVFSTYTVYQINVDYGYWGGAVTTGDAWIGSIQINNIPVKMEPADLNNLGTSPNLTGNPFGEPTLMSALGGDAVWSRASHTKVTAAYQKGNTGWTANLYGGDQTLGTGGESWGAVYIPVNELPLPLLSTARWTYWFTNAEEHGVNMIIWVHNPLNFDQRAEITQAPSHADLERASGWNAHELNQTTDQFFYMGENEPGTTNLSEGTGYAYGLDDYQGDEMFNTWTVYRISFEYGWYSTGVLDDAWVADIELNDHKILLKPDSGGSGQVGHRFSTATGATAIAAALTPKTPFKLMRIDLHLNSAVTTTQENFGANVDGGVVADRYDTKLITQPMMGIQDVVRTFTDGHEYAADKEIDCDWANSDSKTWGLTYTYKVIV